MANEMIWTTQGSYLTNQKLNKDFQTAAQPLVRFRQFVMFKEAFGKSQGESVNWLKVSNVSTYGGQVAETSTMPETTLPLAWGTLTVQEYGLALPFSFKLESLSEFDIQNVMRDALLNDAVKVMEGVIEREFNKTPLRYVGLSASTGTVTTNSTAGGTNTSAFNRYHLRQMVDQLKNRNVPGWPKLGGDYVCIAPPIACAGIFADAETNYSNVPDGFQRILNGEIGRYYGCRIVEDTFATRYVYSPTSRTATLTSWTGSYSAPAYVFGSPTVREAIVVPEEVRMKVATDYGRSKGIAWYMLGGWKIEWDDEPNARIIKWDSA